MRLCRSSHAKVPRVIRTTASIAGGRRALGAGRMAQTGHVRVSAAHTDFTLRPLFCILNRRRRRIPVTILAERASISRMTLNKAEKGELGVSLGTYATVLFSLGMVDRLADVADPRHDAIGRELEEEHLPERIRLPRRQMAASQTPRVRSNGEGSSRIRGVARHPPPGGAALGAHAQGPGNRHL